MAKSNKEMAEVLACQPYSFEVRKDESTEGLPLFIALNPELRGCIGQGTTQEEALADLKDARIDYIESLLDDGLLIPEPKSTIAVTAGTVGKNVLYDPRIDENVDRLYLAEWVVLDTGCPK